LPNKGLSVPILYPRHRKDHFGVGDMMQYPSEFI
jgi:hypothetical protein